MKDDINIITQLCGLSLDRMSSAQAPGAACSSWRCFSSASGWPGWPPPAQTLREAGQAGLDPGWTWCSCEGCSSCDVKPGIPDMSRNTF
jgi:hypothetical protein